MKVRADQGSVPAKEGIERPDPVTSSPPSRRFEGQAIEPVEAPHTTEADRSHLRRGPYPLIQRFLDDGLAASFERSYRGEFGDQDYWRVVTELKKMTLAQLQQVKRAILTGHPHRRRMGRHEALSDTPGDKDVQIRRIVEILKGGVLDPLFFEIQKAERRIGALDDRAVASMTLAERTTLANEIRRIGLPRSATAKYEGDSSGLELSDVERATWGDEIATLPERIQHIRRIAEPIEDAYRREVIRPLRARLKSGQYRPEQFIRDLSDLGPFDRDSFALDLFGVRIRSKRVTELSGDVVPYAPTPVRFALELIEQMKLGKGSVFYDLGSGLGFVAMLVGWVTGARVVGVEYDPVYAEVARARANALGLKNVSFVSADAASLDYHDADAVYLFNPFRGDTLREVTRKLDEVARYKRLDVYGFYTGLEWPKQLTERESGSFKRFTNEGQLHFDRAPFSYPSFDAGR